MWEKVGCVRKSEKNMRKTEICKKKWEMWEKVRYVRKYEQKWDIWEKVW